MTAPQPQKEYIRPRPTPRPPCEECIYQAQSAEHNTAIRNAAILSERERISKEFSRIINDHPARHINHLFIQEFSQSLRTQEQP